MVADPNKHTNKHTHTQSSQPAARVCAAAYMCQTNSDHGRVCANPTSYSRLAGFHPGPTGGITTCVATTARRCFGRVSVPSFHIQHLTQHLLIQNIFFIHNIFYYTTSYTTSSLLWSDPVDALQLRAKVLRYRAPLGSGFLRVARICCGAKAPPLAARPEEVPVTSLT